LGEMDFVDRGRDDRRVALIAAPAEYGVTGIQTFIVQSRWRGLSEGSGSRQPEQYQEHHAVQPGQDLDSRQRWVAGTTLEARRSNRRRECIVLPHDVRQRPFLLVRPAGSAARQPPDRARALWIVSWPFFAVVAIVLGIAAAVEPDTLARRTVTVAAVGSLIILLHTINRAGRPMLASWMLVSRALRPRHPNARGFTGGIFAPVAVFYALFIVMAGMLIGVRGAS